ncbi:MAG: hypothetical protein DBX65_00515, partial [Oscillospiraceae bacterium]
MSCRKGHTCDPCCRPHTHSVSCRKGHTCDP